MVGVSAASSVCFDGKISAMGKGLLSERDRAFVLFFIFYFVVDLRASHFFWQGAARPRLRDFS
jgi:hypothetical protein